MPLVFWLTIFCAGLAAQYLVLTERILFGLILYGLAGSGAFALFSYAKLPVSFKPVFHSTDEKMKRSLAGWWPLVPAFVGAIVSAWYVWNGAQYNDARDFSIGLYCWLGFIFFLFILIARPVVAALRQETKKSLTPLAVLLVLSLLFGFYRLTEIPITVHGDEGMVGVFARRVLNGEIETLFSTAWYAIPQFFYLIPACGMYLLGDTLFGLRASTAILGILSVVPFYFLARSWWGKRAAFFAGLLLITNHWFVHLMHCGVNYVQASFFAITLFALNHFACQRRSLELYIGAGLVMGLSSMSYQANYILPFLWIVSQGWYWLLRKTTFKPFIVSTVLPSFIAGLVIAPLLAHEYEVNNKTELFQARAKSVVVWNEENYKHSDYIYQAQGNSGILWRNQIARTFLSPILYHDASIQYNGFAPFLDFPTSVLFMLGVVLAGYRFFDIRWSLPVLWITGIFTIGGVLTIDPPFFPRLAGATGLFFLLAGGVFSELFNMKSTWFKLNYCAIAFVIAVTITACGLNLYHYFCVYAHTISPQNVHFPQTDMAKFIAQGNPGTRYYVVEDSHFTFSNGTVKFLAPKRIGWTVKQIPERFSDGPVTLILRGPMRLLSNDLKIRLSGFSIRERQGPAGSVLYTTYAKE